MNLMDIIQRMLDEQKWREQKVKQFRQIQKFPETDPVLKRLNVDANWRTPTDADREPFLQRMMAHNPLLADTNKAAYDSAVNFNHSLDLGTPPGFLEDYYSNGVDRNRKEALAKKLNLPL